jgi:hypothetical protein
MTDPNVYEVDSIEDIDGASLRIGVDYDAVSIGTHRFCVGTPQTLRLFQAIVNAWRAATDYGDWDESGDEPA